MRYFIGVDLGGTNIAVGVVNEVGELLGKYSVPTNPSRGFMSVVKDMADACIVVAEKVGLTLDDITSIGVGVPGAVDTRENSVVLAVNLDWRGVPLGDELNKYLDKPVYLGNDADCAALGEIFSGCAKGCSSAVMITIGTGIGGGIIMNKKIFSGCDGRGTEPGHYFMIFGGDTCGCGKKGCFEAYASCTALIRQTKRSMLDNPSSKMWDVCNKNIDTVNGRTAFDAAKLGDEAALAVVDQFITYLAAGTAGLVNIFRPDIVIIGGGVSNEGPYLLDPLNEKLLTLGYGTDLMPYPKAVKATLGNDAGIIGAALLGFSEE
ncbi:MAG: ROK family protein [Oscillospiraceae bacterium]|nr:ROK family protein [Oscillospiraceae bacterium]